MSSFHEVRGRILQGGTETPANNTLQPLKLNSTGELCVGTQLSVPIQFQQARPALTQRPFCWTIFDDPGAATQAFATKAAAANVRHCATHLHATITNFTAPVTPMQVVIRDGGFLAGTIIFIARVTAPVNSTGIISVPLSLVGSVATAMTVEFETGPAATNFQSVWLSGFDLNMLEIS